MTDTAAPTEALFALTVRAEGETRDRHGNLVDRGPGQVDIVETETVSVNIDDLRDAVERRGLTDDQLRDIGLGSLIDTIRSKS